MADFGKPVEQKFDFTSTTYIKALNEWFVAIANVPLMRDTTIATFNFTIRELAKLHNFPLQEEDYLSMTLNGVEVDTGWLEDQKQDPAEYAFYVILYPFDRDSDLFIYFYREDKASIDDYNTSYTDLLKSLGMENKGYISRQEAYDFICAVARKEQEGVFTPPKE